MGELAWGFADRWTWGEFAPSQSTAAAGGGGGGARKDGARIANEGAKT